MELRRPDPALIADISPGMRVIDVGGVDVGTVDMVTLGDPNTVTVQAPTGGTGAGGSLADLVSAAAVTEPDVPPDAKARLRRTGFLKVDGARNGVLYVEADQIADVDDVVRLTVPHSELARED
jgi:hypothetical protein